MQPFDGRRNATAMFNARFATFVDHYNNTRYHESLANLTPADVCFGRDSQILKKREEINRKTMPTRRLRHQTENA